MAIDRIRLSRLVFAAAVVAMSVPTSARGQDEVQIRGVTRVDTTVRLDRGGAVDLSLISGKIRVTGWDRPDVRISASIEPVGSGAVVTVSGFAAIDCVWLGLGVVVATALPRIVRAVSV